MKLYRGQRRVTLQIGGSFLVVCHNGDCGIKHRVQVWNGWISRGAGLRLFGWVALVNIVRPPGKANRSRPLTINCEFCGFEFEELLGRYGCPNCLGEGLEESYG